MNFEKIQPIRFIGLLLIIIFIIFEYNRYGDFSIYYHAASNLYRLPDLYHPLYSEPPTLFYLGNPVITLLIYPFTYLPLSFATLLVKLVDLVLLYRIWIIISSYLSIDLHTSKIKNLLLIITFASCFISIYYNLHLVQFTIIMLYCSLEGIYQISQNKNIPLGSFLIAFAVLTKISPIVLLPYLIYRNHFKAFMWTILFLGVLVGSTFIFIEPTKSLFLWSKWWYLINPIDPDSIFDMNNRKNHGISTLLSTLFIKDITDNIVELTNRRYLIDLGREQVKVLITVARVILIGLTFYFLRSLPFVKQKIKQNEFWELSYLLLIIPLFFPQQRIYNFIFVLPAIAYLCYHLIVNKQQIKNYHLKLGAFVFCVLLFNFEMIFGQLRLYLWYYKTMTYATLFVLILLMWMRPTSRATITPIKT